MKTVATILLLASTLIVTSCAFSPVVLLPPASSRTASSASSVHTGQFTHLTNPSDRFFNTRLYMSDKEKERSSKKGLQTLIKEKTEEKQDEKKEEQYRVLLHNDEVHTFQYVVRSLTKVIGTLDRKAAFEICVETHGRGKAIITKTWKKQAMQFCMGLQRQGLTVSITPDEDFDGGHWGGGNV